MDVLCSTVCSESFRFADTKNSIFVTLFLNMPFDFPQQAER